MIFTKPQEFLMLFQYFEGQGEHFGGLGVNILIIWGTVELIAALGGPSGAAKGAKRRRREGQGRPKGGHGVTKNGRRTSIYAAEYVEWLGNTRRGDLSDISYHAKMLPQINIFSQIYPEVLFTGRLTSLLLFALTNILRVYRMLRDSCRIRNSKRMIFNVQSRSASSVIENAYSALLQMQFTTFNPSHPVALSER